MDVCVLTGDLIFFSAVEGVAGAMGHHARQAADIETIGVPDVLIADFASLPADLPSLVAACDPLRTAAFVPHVDVAALTSARASGLAHVYRRGALATELPRLLAEYATGQ